METEYPKSKFRYALSPFEFFQSAYFLHRKLYSGESPRMWIMSTPVYISLMDDVAKTVGLMPFGNVKNLPLFGVPIEINEDPDSPRMVDATGKVVYI